MKNERNVNDYRINDRIRIVMRVYNMNQKELSEAITVSTGRISNILNWQNRPDSIFLERFLNYFKDVNGRWLITGEGNIKDKNEVSKGSSVTKDDSDIKQSKTTEDISLKEIISLQKFKIQKLEEELAICKEGNNV